MEKIDKRKFNKRPNVHPDEKKIQLFISFKEKEIRKEGGKKNMIALLKKLYKKYLVD